MPDLKTALNLSVAQSAKLLLGCDLIRTINNKEIICRIVETEAYDQLDPASHSFRGPTTRTSIMFGPAGYSYVYFTYGMHYCMNIVVGPNGHGAAVLLRAVEPLKGIELIRKNRPSITSDIDLTNGPAKLCKALEIDKALYGHDLEKKPLRLQLNKPIANSRIVSTTRIGISKATNLKWRFYIKDNQYVSRG